uniref:pirin family protein n=1 Tax=uncultured Planktosalinus sp. TaxID=1810935 RepID=UPI0030D71A01
MSNIGLIIEERSRDIGDFLVGRLLPFRKKRMVGPFIFIDHMGPTKLGPHHYMDVNQHPHTGLSTLTFMLEGEILHRDSMGSHQIIKPGAVNWMVAGKGVAHTERTPPALRNGNSFTAHGYQIWVALPKKLEDCEPEFHHFDADQLPTWKEGSTSFKLIAGEGYGHKSPVPVKSELFMIEINTVEQFELQTKNNLKGEIGICIVEGEIEACGNSIKKGNMAVSKVEDTCNVLVKANTHLLLFGGKPFEEERFIYW